MSELIKRDYVIELIKNSYYDLANSEDDMWSMVADVEKLPVIEIEDNGLKSDFEVMDTLIYSIPDVLSDVKEELNRAVFEIHLLRLQYEQLKKEYKELQEKLETFDMEFEYCPHCDAKIYAHTDYEYCPYCGEKLDQ